MIALNRVEAVTSWAPYVRDIAERMRLSDFEIMLAEEKCGDEFGAEVECYGSKKTAIIFLSDGFLNDSPIEQRRIIVHELIHALFHVFDGMINGLLDKRAYELLEYPFEVAVEDLTRIIAPSMPLPGKPVDVPESNPPESLALVELP